MLRIILAGCELELPPPDIAGHPAIRKHADSIGKRPSQVLLDQNLHAPAIAKLDDNKRRGRPDITHVTLLTILESPLAKSGGLEVALHTRGGELLRIRTDTRLPRSESRFAGLISKVLAEGAGTEKAPLVWSDGRLTPAEVLSSFAKGPVVRLDEGGAAKSPAQLAQLAKDNDLTLVLGAFAAGDFDVAWKVAAPDAVSIWKDALNAWAVAGEVVAGWRAVHGPA